MCVVARPAFGVIPFDTSPGPQDFREKAALWLIIS